MFHGTIQEQAQQGEALLSSLVEGSSCVAQAWDDRIDCLLKLRDGGVIGEMVSVDGLTEARIRATAERFRKRAAGLNEPLVDELRPPWRIHLG